MDRKNKNKIMKIFEQYKVPSDIYDYEAMWDNKINEEENISRIKGDIEILASSNDFEEKIKSDFETKKKTINNEKEIEDKTKLEMMKKELENTQKEFKKSLEQVDKNNSVLDKLYYLPKRWIEAIVSDTNELYGLIFTGKAGISKTYSTIQTLNDLKTDYTYFAGYTTPLGLYKFLYDNKEKGKTIVFDDTFGILNNTTSVMLMLNALYSSSGKRKISWNSSKLKDITPEFLFEANVILIINEVPKTIGSSLINSRCLNYEFEFNNFEILAIMKAIAKLKHKSLSKEQRMEVFDFIKYYADETTENFDLRTQNKIENLYLFDEEEWKDLSMPLINTKNEKLLLIKQLIKESISLVEAKSKWYETTGLSERSFQRHHKQLNEATIRHKK